MDFYKRLLFFLLALLQSAILLSINNEIQNSWHEHPYLFFSESDIPEIRKRMEKEPFSTRWDIFIKNANAVLQTEPHYYNIDKGEIGRSRKHLEYAGKTSFAYVITKDKKYSKRAIAEAMAIIKGVIPEKDGELVWYNPKHRNWNKGADLNTAELCYGLAMVYDWCYDVMTPEEREKIKEAILNKGIKQYINSIERESPDFYIDNPVSNWAGVVSGGMGLAALAIYNESEVARKAVQFAQKYIPQFLDHVFLIDGGGHEGIMYARYGELFALYFMMANQRLFGLDLEFLEKFNQKLAGYWDIYLQAPDMRYANFNNMGEETFQGLWGIENQSHGGPNSDINALMENLVPGGDPMLLWAADNGAPRFYWNGASPWYFLWRREDAESMMSNEKPELQDAVLFRGAGHVIFQSDKLWLAYNGGWTSNRSHNNRDLGSFILVVDNERFIHDPGYGDSEAKNHSTIVINNKDQLNNRAGEYLKFGTGESFHYLANDLTDVYEDSTLKRFVRHMLMLNGDCIVILDELNAEKSTEIEWLLQTRKDVYLSDYESAVIKDQTNNMLIIDAGEKMKTTIKTWEGKNGKLNAVTKVPVNKKEEYVIVTVLFPFKNGEYNEENLVTSRFKNGLLTINHGGKKDEINFVKTEKGWFLGSINNNSNLSISDTSERVLIPCRENSNNSINSSSLPKWFFPIK